MEKPFSALNWGIDDISMYEGVPNGFEKKPVHISGVFNMLIEVPSQQQQVQAQQIQQLSEIQSLSPAPSMAETNNNVSIKQEALSPSPVPAQETFTALRPSTLELQAVSPAPSSTSTTPCSDATPEVDEGIIKDFEEQKNKMETMCRNLWIPKDPYQWNSDQVQKWCFWVLREYYNLELSFLPEFCMDGTSLCMLSQDDFVNRSNDVGYFLFAELEWWKTVIMSEKQEQEEELTYTDLSTPCSSTSPATTALTPTASLAATSMDNILSIPMPSMDSMPTLPTIPTPVLSTLSETSSTLNQINLEVTQNYQYTAPNTYQPSAVSPAPSWDDTDSGCMTSSPGYAADAMDAEDEAEEVEPPRRTYMSHSKHTIHLWQFLKDLLLSPEYYGNYIKWLDRSRGIFKIEDSAQVAKLWGKRKNRPAMNYDKLSRSIRQYYKKGIIKKTSQSKRLVYQFQPNYL